MSPVAGSKPNSKVGNLRSDRLSKGVTPPNATVKFSYRSNNALSKSKVLVKWNIGCKINYIIYLMRTPHPVI